MGGIMTWSINWDSSQNNNSFANENGAFLSQFKTVTPEPSTEEPTTSTVEEGGVEINGYQVSNTVGGMRTVYTVSNKINGKNVVEKGMVYGIGTYTNVSEMYVGNTSRYVASFAANISNQLCNDNEVCSWKCKRIYNKMVCKSIRKTF